MRHTFGIHLSKGGVSPRTAQVAMRHFKIELTMNTYTDPRLLDVLPALPLDNDGQTERAKATGTNARTLVPLLVPTSGNRGTDRIISGRSARDVETNTNIASVDIGRVRESVARDVEKRVKGLEPSTATLATWCSTN